MPKQRYGLCKRNVCEPQFIKLEMKKLLFNFVQTHTHAHTCAQTKDNPIKYG